MRGKYSGNKRNKQIDKETLEFYKEQLRSSELRWISLHENYSIIIDEVLGKNYFNYGNDVYSCDHYSREDILKEFKELKADIKTYKLVSIILLIVGLIAIII